MIPNVSIVLFFEARQKKQNVNFMRKCASTEYFIIIKTYILKKILRKVEKLNTTRQKFARSAFVPMYSL